MEQAGFLLDTAQPPPSAGDQIEALGRRDWEDDTVILRDGIYRAVSGKTNNNLGPLPLLTKAIQVKSLDRKEAQRAYPVKIQGVITAHVGTAFVIQDSTASVFIFWSASIAGELPAIGDYWEIEGESCVDFAPNIQVHRGKYLRSGILPEPLRPTADELINGSLDTKYVEIQGIAAAVNGNELTLLTRESKVRLLLYDLIPKDLQSLTRLEGALIRVQGMCSPGRDKDQRILPLLRLFNSSVSVDEPPPPNPFETPLKRASDLLFFDAHADAFRRPDCRPGDVRASRRVFPQDGATGLRFIPKSPIKLAAGDLVEVVGFVNMEGPSPVLRDAQARRTGKAGMAAARPLLADEMLSGELDSTLVRVQSRLIGLSVGPSGQVLELQAELEIMWRGCRRINGLLSGKLPGKPVGIDGGLCRAGRGPGLRPGR